jgi:hypothetical protein
MFRRVVAEPGCDFLRIQANGAHSAKGAFVAQIANDRERRLSEFSLPLAPGRTVEALLAPRGGAGTLTTWGCKEKRLQPPEWFNVPHKMRWVGSVYKPGTNAAEAFRLCDLLNDFDGILYLPSVTADDIPRETSSHSATKLVLSDRTYAAFLPHTRTIQFQRQLTFSPGQLLWQQRRVCIGFLGPTIGEHVSLVVWCSACTC